MVGAQILRSGAAALGTSLQTKAESVRGELGIKYPSKMMIEAATSDADIWLARSQRVPAEADRTSSVPQLVDRGFACLNTAAAL